MSAHPEPLSLAGLVHAHAERRPTAPFVTHIDSKTTHDFASVERVAHRLASTLERSSVGPGDRVGFMVRNHWLFFPLLVACAERRAILLPIDPELHRDELAFELDHGDPRVLIVDDHATAPPGTRKLVRLGELTAEPQIKHGALHTHSTAANAIDPLLMIYTSGTTSSGKAVMLTERNLVSMASSLVDRYRIQEGDRLCCVLPTHHMNAVMVTGIAPLVAGAHVFLFDVLSIRFAKFYFQHVGELGITICSLVPSMLALLLELFPRGAPAPLPALRFVFCGAAPLPAPLWRRFEETFAVPVYQGYGLTETTCWATSVPPDEPRRWDTVGVPLDAEIRIDPAAVAQHDAVQFDGVPIADSATMGEVQIRAPVVFAGYYGDPEVSRTTMTADGYFRSGDYGYIDGDGYLHIVGRLKDIIIRNGINIYGRDLDAVMVKHPMVAECKTIGLPDPLLGERAWCVCVPAPGATVTEGALRQWVRDQVSISQAPDRVMVMGYLPLGSSGKVSIKTLRKIVTGELRDEIVASLVEREYVGEVSIDLVALKQLVQRCLESGRPIEVVCDLRLVTQASALAPDVLERLRRWADHGRRSPRVAPQLLLLLDGVSPAGNDFVSELRRRAAALGLATEEVSQPMSELAARFPEAIWLRVEPRGLDATVHLALARDAAYL
jgi:acyl-CoA synthetase (AMP-forming)/AMP-acid ligase II